MASLQDSQQRSRIEALRSAIEDSLGASRLSLSSGRPTGARVILPVEHSADMRASIRAMSSTAAEDAGDVSSIAPLDESG